MCGIAGGHSTLLSTLENNLVVEKIIDTRPNRGPDQRVLIDDENIILGFRRLAINDLLNGDQPFRSQDNKIIVIVNGEIYNHKKIKREVLDHGLEYKTNSDCEVVLHLYEKFGLKFYDHIDGMFAVAIYDASIKKLILARDINGEKPLYFSKDEKGFWFSSDFSALTHASSFALRTEYLTNYFKLNYDPSLLTMTENVFKLQPGTICTYDLTKCTYTLENMLVSNPNHHQSGDLNAIEHNLNSAVFNQFSADSDVAIALSGGLDSNFLLHSAVKQGFTNIKAITVGYDIDFALNEHELAKRSATNLSIPIHTVIISEAELFEEFEDYVSSLNEPIADFAGYSYYRLAKKANELGVKVLIFGNGFDELSFGYHWSRRVTAINRLFNREIDFRRFVKEYSTSFNIEYTTLWTVRNLLKSIRDLSSDTILILKNLRCKKPLCYEITPGYKTLKDDTDAQSFKKSWVPTFENENQNLSGSSFVQKSLINGYLQENGFNQIDSLTMRHSVEGRSPFVARKVRYSLQEYFSNSGRYQYGKRNFLGMYEDYLPNFLTKRSKTGFSVPIKKFYGNLLSRYNIEDALTVIRRYSEDPNYIEHIKLHLDRTGNLQLKFKLILLSVWLQKNIEAPSDKTRV